MVGLLRSFYIAPDLRWNHSGTTSVHAYIGECVVQKFCVEDLVAQKLLDGLSP